MLMTNAYVTWPQTRAKREQGRARESQRERGRAIDGHMHGYMSWMYGLRERAREDRAMRERAREDRAMTVFDVGT